MNSKTISTIEKEIFRQFPEVATGSPSVQPQASPKSKGQSSTYLLTFKGRIEQPGGFAFNRTVRVVADDDGNILKVTTSR